MNADNVAAISDRIKLFRVSYAWKVRKKIFRATTIWGARTLAGCKEDFARRNPHIISFTVQSEVRP